MLVPHIQWLDHLHIVKLNPNSLLYSLFIHVFDNTTAMVLRLCAVRVVATPTTIRTASVTAPACAAIQFLRPISSAHIRQEQQQQSESNLPDPRILERPSEHPCLPLYSLSISIFPMTIHSHPTPHTEVGILRAPIVNPADKYLNQSESLHSYGRYLLSCLPKYIQQFSVWKDELTIYIPPTAILLIFSFLKNHTAAQFTQVSDICGADYPTRKYRFEIVYNLLSVRHNSRIRVKTYADEVTPVPSICQLYDGANWFEREAHDLYGIFFAGHPDLRRIMTDYGFDGHPLRKDFPLTGYTEVRWDEEKKRIVSEPLELTQQFRNFQGGSSVWEPVGPGMDVKPDSVSCIMP